MASDRIRQFIFFIANRHLLLLACAAADAALIYYIMCPLIVCVFVCACISMCACCFFAHSFECVCVSLALSYYIIYFYNRSSSFFLSPLWYLLINMCKQCIVDDDDAFDLRILFSGINKSSELSSILIYISNCCCCQCYCYSFAKYVRFSSQFSRLNFCNIASNWFQSCCCYYLELLPAISFALCLFTK